ncbi:MAG: hypothetical protein HZA93_23920 [Verrucomicrobia bacterium]|nr:hypothetical protein [Verrucomicrobiota bacterium]
MITAAQVTNAATKVSEGKRRRWAHLHNRSNVTIYVKYDGSDTALTVANGLPIPPNGERQLGNAAGDQDFWHDIWAIHDDGANEHALVIHEA